VKIKCLIHEAEEGGFWAEVPSLPGCFTEGETVEETLGNLREAIACYLDDPLLELIYSLPGQYRLIDTDEYLEEKHREAALEDR
jgi:predicted RNase H-like HicB family nuclease